MGERATKGQVSELLAQPFNFKRTPSIVGSVELTAGCADGDIAWNEFSILADLWRDKFAPVMQQLLDTDLPAVMPIELRDEDVLKAIQVGAVLAAIDVVVGLNNLSPIPKF